MRDFLPRQTAVARVRRAARGQLRQNARDFDSFFFGKLDQAIIQFDGFERLDEHRLARGAGGVHHARNRAAVARRAPE